MRVWFNGVSCIFYELNLAFFLFGGTAGLWVSVLQPETESGPQQGKQGTLAPRPPGHSPAILKWRGELPFSSPPLEAMVNVVQKILQGSAIRLPRRGSWWRLWVGMKAGLPDAEPRCFPGSPAVGRAWRDNPWCHRPTGAARGRAEIESQLPNDPARQAPTEVREWWPQDACHRLASLWQAHPIFKLRGHAEAHVRFKQTQPHRGKSGSAENAVVSDYFILLSTGQLISFLYRVKLP